MVRAILTDIEGTTTSLNFVKDELFPYAYERFEDFIRNNTERLQDVFAEVNGIMHSELTLDESIQILKVWFEQDKKFTPLKTIQGMIWEEGYRNRNLRGHLYEDAFNTLRYWYLKRMPVYIYSSGSVAAQKLLFRYSMYGKISHLIAGHFDTNIGSKLQSQSYSNIAEQLDIPTKDILFLSDNPAEIEAAKQAGMQVQLVDREGKAPNSVRTFHSINL